MAYDVTVDWGTIQLGPPPFDISSLTGWVGIPGGSYESQDSSHGHGQAPTPIRQQQRIVQASGFLRVGPSAGRNALVAQMRASLRPRRSTDADTSPLLVTLAGVAGTAGAQLLEFDIAVSESWAMGFPKWSAQWRCPDPRIYGAEVSASVPLVVDTPGLALPQILPMLLPEQPLGGRLAIVNPGTDDEGSPAIYRLTGAQSGTVGVRNVTTGVTVTYGFGLSATDVLEIDTELGGAWLNGAYRPPAPYSDVTAALRLAPGQNIIQALGSAGAGSPTLTVRAQPASW